MMRREGSRREYREAAGAVAEGMTPSTMSGSLISDLSNVTGAGRGVGVGFRWSSKVPHFGFWLTVECFGWRQCEPPWRDSAFAARPRSHPDLPHERLCCESEGDHLSDLRACRLEMSLNFVLSSMKQL